MLYQLSYIGLPESFYRLAAGRAKLLPLLSGFAMEIEREKAARQQGDLFLGRIVPTEAKPLELSGEIL